MRQIGLDVGCAWVKAAQRDRSGRIERVAAFPRTNAGAGVDAQEAVLFAESLLRHGFEPSPIIIGMNARDVRLEEVDAPPVSDEHALDRIILGEIGRLSHWEPDTYTAQWWRVPSPTRASVQDTFFSIAAPISTVDSSIEPLTAAGFDVQAVDLRVGAAARLCAARAESDRLVIVVDVGWSCVEIAAYLDQRLVFVRRLEGAGLASIDESLPRLRLGDRLLAESLALGRGARSPAWDIARTSFAAGARRIGENLVAEINLTLTYLARRFPSAQRCDVLVAGGGARIDELIEPLATSPDVGARRAEPGQLVGFCARAASQASEPIFVSACGLAMWREER
ncbi:MAG: hypothetical protein DYG94_04825 [Leptolyngbya sp. PLA3]|nr:MAG: hypothetical protein EDM82_03975 [Cyanobacteria bacterium CYA]MCE7968056.1 hypothetical protein [Leptolyngbya sp. PL-A3]